ncbi:serine hydrolase [Acidobacteriota bacterium]
MTQKKAIFRRDSIRQARCVLFLFLFMLVVGGLSAATTQAPTPNEIDSYVLEAMKIWDVPGLSLALVKDGKVFLTRGYGVRELGKPELVDENTLFSLGSCSKAFGATAVALLVDDGKVSWNDRVVDHLPWFRLDDPWLTREMRIMDIMTHRSGTGQTNQLRPISKDRRDYLERLRFAEPLHAFRQYRYSNDMYILSGQLVEEVSGMTWDEFSRQRIWDLLAMNSTTSRIARVRASANRSTPHIFKEKFVGSNKTPGPPLKHIVWDYADDIAVPSGGIASSAKDMAEWLKFHLGLKESAQVLKPETLQLLHAPHTVIHNPAWWWMIGEEKTAYAMGWVTGDFLGKTVVSHGGEAGGYNASVCFLPEEGFGIYVASNRNSFLPYLLVRHFISTFFNAGTDRDWNAEYMKSVNRQNEAAAKYESARKAGRLAGIGPSLALEKYTGSYKNDFAGALTVEIRENRLIATIAGREPLVLELDHWHIDRFVDERGLFPTIYFNFDINELGKVVGVDVSYFGKFRKSEK